MAAHVLMQVSRTLKHCLGVRCFMKVCTLIPAFKPKYLPELLTALCTQTVKPARVIFSDDSPGGVYRTALNAEPMQKMLSQLNVDVVEGPRAGRLANMRNLLDVWGGSTERAHFLFDDDIIYPTFYQRHLGVHQAASIACSISKCWSATESGQPIGALSEPAQIVWDKNRIAMLGASSVFASVVPTVNNWFGELSNAVFDHSLHGIIHDLRLGGNLYVGLEDVGSFLRASLDKPLCFLNEPLGYFRTNPYQNSADVYCKEVKTAFFAWFGIALGGRQLGLLTQAQVLESFRFNTSGSLYARYLKEADMAPFCELVPRMIAGESAAEDLFLDAWNAYVVGR